jgi:hypothetical protein
VSSGIVDDSRSSLPPPPVTEVLAALDGYRLTQEISLATGVKENPRKQNRARS